MLKKAKKNREKGMRNLWRKVRKAFKILQMSVLKDVIAAKIMKKEVKNWPKSRTESRSEKKILRKTKLCSVWIINLREAAVNS
jgi:hypothetical protein